MYSFFFTVLDIALTYTDLVILTPGTTRGRWCLSLSVACSSDICRIGYGVFRTSWKIQTSIMRHGPTWCTHLPTIHQAYPQSTIRNRERGIVLGYRNIVSGMVIPPVLWEIINLPIAPACGQLIFAIGCICTISHCSSRT